ncbi:MAG: hypothetical protein K8W52_08410 [Deltaproteobacteria bacterium]|nr:hypothetical protein [Deltaproteobacteria bacterium]
MARIRIVDEWLRSPASPPTHYRSIMVVAEGWAEQRVMMRAYAESPDQTRPTITLYGAELAIGPAGVDPHGPWGIHVQPPVDGRAQELRDQLALAAQRLAGSKGTPPRLADEAGSFERKRTNNWAPGTPRDVQGSQTRPNVYYEPQVAASQALAAQSQGFAPAPLPYDAFAPPPVPQTYVPGQQAQAYSTPGQPPGPLAAPPMTPDAQYLPSQPTAQYVPSEPAAQYVPAQPAAQYIPSSPGAEYVPTSAIPAQPSLVATSPVNPEQRMTPLPRTADTGRRRGWTSPIQPVSNGRTALGYQSGAGAQSAVIRLGLRPAAAQRLARIVDRTVPSDFQISGAERDVLNALGEQSHLTARQIGTLIGVADPVSWMEQLAEKLASYGLDLIGPGPAAGGEPTYVLRR